MSVLANPPTVFGLSIMSSKQATPPSKKLSRRRAVQASLAGLVGLTTLGIFAQHRRTTAVTPEQTEGPFFPTRPYKDTDADLTQVANQKTPAHGDIVFIEGGILDDKGEIVADALIDIWQANHYGRYDHERETNPAPLDQNFQGWARIRSDQQGRYRIKTIVPGPYPVSNEWQRPPHIHFKVSKGEFHELTTQMYFAGHALNKNDKILQALSKESCCGIELPRR